MLFAVKKYQDQGAVLTGIAKEAQLPNSTAHRILAVLVQRGLISFDPISKNYQLGIELFNLGSAVQQLNIKNHFRAALENIAGKSGDTVYLLIRSAYDCMCIDLVEGRYPIKALTYGIGDRLPLGIGSGSLALLAFLPDNEVEYIISANKERYLNYNQSTKKIRRVVQQSRKLAYALSEGLRMKGVNGVGVPILDEKKKVCAAISVGSVSLRLDKKRREKIVKLIKSEIRKLPK